MCTAITFQSQQKENYFGRTMDFSYDIEPQVYVVPKHYVWRNKISQQEFCNNYSFIGIGQEMEGELGFFDGVNERGLAAAVLYFAGYAKFNRAEDYPEKQPVASSDVLHYFLGRFNSIDELKAGMKDISIVGMPDPITRIVAPLHWIVTDQSGKSVVIEQTEKGFLVYDNPIGVMANSPDFQWHLTNLRNYLEVSPEQIGESSWGTIKLSPFGQAGGTMMLPGGYTSPERFVRTAYLKTHIQVPKNRIDTIMACFHILDSVSIPQGVVITSQNTSDYTKYTAFINTNTCEYYFKTYYNRQITTACLWDYNKALLQPICVGKLARPVFFDGM